MARVAVVLLVLALCGCAGSDAARPSDEPPRFTDEGTGTSADQCDLPVEERTGGWLCPDEK